MSAPPPSRLPGWLRPVAEASGAITVDELTRFAPPADSEPRRGAVLVLFADRPDDPVPPDDPAHRGEVLLTERAHDMRSHPGQVSFPGGGLDPGETAVEAALREAEEETGLDPSGVHVFGELPVLWLPPSNFAVTPVLAHWHEPGDVTVASPAEVHALHHVAIADLMDPEHRVTVTHPSGYSSPGFLIGDDHDVILWGFTAGILSRLFDFVGWSGPWDQARVRDLPPHMLQGDTTRHRVRPNTRFEEK